MFHFSKSNAYIRNIDINVTCDEYIRTTKQYTCKRNIYLSQNKSESKFISDVYHVCLHSKNIYHLKILNFSNNQPLYIYIFQIKKGKVVRRTIAVKLYARKRE